MSAYQEGVVTGTVVTLGVVAVAVFIAYSYKAEIALWLLKREREAIAKDPLGRIYGYIRPETTP